MRSAITGFLAALSLAAVGSASALIAVVDETATMIPDESVLELDVLLAQPTSRVAGTIDIQHEISGGAGVAGIPALDGVLLDPVDVTVPLGEASIRIQAPASSISVSAVATGSTLNTVTDLGGEMYGFDQGNVNVDLAGTVTLTAGSDVIPLDLATIGTIVNQSILEAKLTLDPNGNRIEAPVALEVLLPLDANTSLPVSVTGTLVGVVPEPGMLGVALVGAVLLRRRG